MKTTKFNIKPLIAHVHDEIAGTGLEFAIVVWRPGFMDRGDPVAVGTRARNDVEVCDALMRATDSVTEAMREARTENDPAA